MDPKFYSFLMNENKNIFINGRLERMLYFRIFVSYSCFHIYVPESQLDDFISMYPGALPKKFK